MRKSACELKINYDPVPNDDDESVVTYGSTKVDWSGFLAKAPPAYYKHKTKPSVRVSFLLSILASKNFSDGGKCDAIQQECRHVLNQKNVVTPRNVYVFFREERQRFVTVAYIFDSKTNVAWYQSAVHTKLRYDDEAYPDEDTDETHVPLACIRNTHRYTALMRLFNKPLSTKITGLPSLTEAERNDDTKEAKAARRVRWDKLEDLIRKALFVKENLLDSEDERSEDRGGACGFKKNMKKWIHEILNDEMYSASRR